MIKIKIEGCKISPLWVTIQNMVAELLNKEGKLTRIAKTSGNQNDYRSAGTYELTFTPSDIGDDTHILLEVVS